MPALRSLAALVAIAAVVAIVARSGVFDDASVQALRARIDAFGSLGPLVFMGLIGAGLFFPSPLLLLIGAGGAAFGALWAFVYGWIAGVVGSIVVFALARQTVGAWVRRRGGVRTRGLRAIDERLARSGFATVLGLRVVFCMAPPLTWALGASCVRWPDYVAGTALGIVPALALSAYLGDAVGDSQAWTALLTARVLLPALLAVAFAVTGTVLGRRVFGDGSP